MMRRCASARRGRARLLPELPANSQSHLWARRRPGSRSGTEIEAALENLKTVGDVAVSTHEDVNQMSYAITFTSLGTPANLGNLPLLRATHLHLGDAARVSVRKISTGCCDVSLSFNGYMIGTRSKAWPTAAMPSGRSSP